MSMKISEYGTCFTVKNEVNVRNVTENSTFRMGTQAYSRALEQKYSYFNSSSFINGVSVSVSVSEEYLTKCVENPDSAALLEKKLDDLPDYVSGLTEKYSGNLKSITCAFDENGKQTVSVIIPDDKKENESDTGNVENDETDPDQENGKVTVAVNVEKRSRQIASAKTQEQIRTVIELLKEDIAECKDGLSKGWCDENEVAKAESLMKRAKEKQSQMPKESSEENNVNSDMEFLLNMIM